MNQLSFEELRDVLLGHAMQTEKKNEEIKVLMSEITGQPVTPDTLETDRLRKLVYGELYGLMANRLLTGNSDTPVLTGEDFLVLMPPIVNSIQKNGEPIEPEVYGLLELMIKNVFDNLLNVLKGALRDGESYFDSNWRLVNTILDLARKQGLSPTEYLGLADSMDEITRAYQTREEYVKAARVATAMVSDPEFWKKTLLMPIIEGLTQMADLDEADLASVNEQVEAEIMPGIREMCDKATYAMGKYYAQEADRIYG